MPGEGGGEVEDDLRIDSMGENGEDFIGMQNLHQKLIDIDEEIGADEFEALKFLCRDFIPAARLQKAEAPLDVFMEMKKLVLIDFNNVDFLLELLGRIHRYDLIRKLDMDVVEVRRRLSTFRKLEPFRSMLLTLSEDLDEKEAEKIRFFLRGILSKKMLNERQSMLQLMIFMEQEGLLASDNVEMLTNVMESIRRGDLIDRIREFQGLQPLQRSEPGLAPITQGNTTPIEPPAFLPPSDIPSRQQLRPAQNSNPGIGTNRQIDRSPSAGTLSVSSDENVVQPVGGLIPETVLQQIVAGVNDVDENLAIELGYSNEQIISYSQQFLDRGQRVKRFILDWQSQQADRGVIASRLLYALNKLGCKVASQAVEQWMERFEDRQVTQNSASNPEGSENHYSSYRHAVPVSQAVTQNEPQPPYERVMQDLSKLGITTQNLPHDNDVNFVNDVALYQLQGQIVANSGISQRLTRMPFTVDAIVPPNQHSPPVRMVNAGTSAQTIIPATSQGFPTYRMDRKPRGWCVIINNEQFKVDTGDREAKEMPPRIGTERDTENLCNTFGNLGFIVRRYDNLRDDEMMSTLVDVAHNVCHDNFDCFVCCILTHGVLNNLYGSNGKLVSIKDLTSTFQTNRCKSLAGKPKLFFFQACQGRDKMRGGHIEPDGPGEHAQNIQSAEMIPNEADFLLGYATVPGYVSFRSRNQGSWYIRKLCELLDKHAYRYDLMSILVELTREVSNANANMDNDLYKQCPAPFVTLRKQLFFKFLG